MAIRLISKDGSVVVSDIDYREGVQQWFSGFESALSARDVGRLTSLLAAESFLRDNGALTFDYLQWHGTEAVVATLVEVEPDIRPHDFVLSRRWPEPRIIGEGEDARLEAFADFETNSLRATAFIYAQPNDASPYGFEVYAIFTRIEGVLGVEPPAPAPRGIGFEPSRPDENWLDRRDLDREYVDREPEVLIIGGGQAGLITSAHLKNLGVSSLIIERHPRVGDNWRDRYDSLFLHNPIEMNSFPFLEFPPQYPQYLPKDVIADWLEIYQRYLDLDTWTSTEFVHADYDDDKNEWTALVRRADGTERILHPKHIVQCSGGFGGKLFFPTMEGLGDYKGTVIHSEQYRRASEYNAKRAIVFGVATSGSDVAEDLNKNGVDVTLVQRGPIIVTDLETANETVYAGFLDPEQSTELVDIRYSMGWIYPIRVTSARKNHALMLEKDTVLLNGLREAGLQLWDGPNGMGWLGLYWTRGGGYYLNKGASEMIIRGEIDILQSERIAHVVENGVLLEDGTVLEADMLVFATGYESRVADVIDQFGPDMVPRLGTVAVLDETGEWRGVWGQSGQRGLWLNGGGINSARPQSERVALLIKADLDGHIPDSFRRPPRDVEDTRFSGGRVLVS